MQYWMMAITVLLLWPAIGGLASAIAPAWSADVGQTAVKVYQVQQETFTDTSGIYDWGACVMKDGDIYRMWWTRPCPPSPETFSCEATADDGKSVTLHYTPEGDRTFYAESRDGYT